MVSVCFFFRCTYKERTIKNTELQLLREHEGLIPTGQFLKDKMYRLRVEESTVISGNRDKISELEFNIENLMAGIDGSSSAFDMDSSMTSTKKRGRHSDVDLDDVVKRGRR